MEGIKMKEEGSDAIRKIRQRRDKELCDAMGYAFIGIYAAMWALIIVLEWCGAERTANAIGISMMLTAAILLILLIITANPQGIPRMVCMSAISWTVLTIQLVCALPGRTILHGISGYKKYAKKEIKRISKLEMSRWMERL